MHGDSPTEAVVGGFRHGARVVTAAALIMISVFARLHRSAATRSSSRIGFALAVGVLFDAFVVRMTIVPAVMALLGERAWWLPRWLDRILPERRHRGRQSCASTPRTAGEDATYASPPTLRAGPVHLTSTCPPV